MFRPCFSANLLTDVFISHNKNLLIKNVELWVTEISLGLFYHSIHILCQKLNWYNLTFTLQHIINKSNTEVSTHYWIICLYSLNICFHIFNAYKAFIFFWNIYFKVGYIITIEIYSWSMSSYLFAMIKIYYKYPFLCLRQIISLVSLW